MGFLERFKRVFTSESAQPKATSPEAKVDRATSFQLTKDTEPTLPPKGGIMELVYPIYLDTPMMTGFLASLEGGLVEEKELKSTSAGAKEQSKSGRLGISLPGLLSGIIGGGAEAEFGKRVSESLESQYKSTVRFPSIALFIRLRALLLEQKLVKVIDEPKDLDRVSMGDIVEFQGIATPNPADQIRSTFNQLMPLIGPMLSLTESQLESAIQQLRNAKPEPDKPFTMRIGDQETKFDDPLQISVACTLLESQRQQAHIESTIYEAMGQVLAGLFPEESLNTVLFKAKGFQAVCRVYSSFARDERIRDIYDAHWHCLGKVVGIVRDSDKYDLLKGSPIGYIAKDQFPALVKSLNKDSLNVDISEPVLVGPALVVATLAIFA